MHSCFVRERTRGFPPARTNSATEPDRRVDILYSTHGENARACGGKPCNTLNVLATRHDDPDRHE